jgi:hypothetical protein
MEKEKAFQILLEVALVAQAKGVLTLDDAVIVKQAVDVVKELIPKDDIQEGEL